MAEVKKQIGKKVCRVVYRRKYGNGHIYCGMVEGAERKEDVIGFRLLRDRKIIYWLDMTISEALDISAGLTKAVNDYLLTKKKYIPQPSPTYYKKKYSIK